MSFSEDSIPRGEGRVESSGPLQVACCWFCCSRELRQDPPIYHLCSQAASHLSVGRVAARGLPETGQTGWEDGRPRPGSHSLASRAPSSLSLSSADPSVSHHGHGSPRPQSDSWVPTTRKWSHCSMPVKSQLSQESAVFLQSARGCII